VVGSTTRTPVPGTCRNSRNVARAGAGALGLLVLAGRGAVESAGKLQRIEPGRNARGACGRKRGGVPSRGDRPGALLMPLPSEGAYPFECCVDGLT
jgi:hypothetical protein